MPTDHCDRRAATPLSRGCRSCHRYGLIDVAAHTAMSPLRKRVYCRRPSMSEWISLPVEGAALTLFRFRGNPKHGEARIETEGNPPLTIPTGCFDITFGANVNFSVAVRALDDVNFEYRVAWRQAHRAVLTGAKVNWWLSPAEWKDVLADWSGRSRWHLCVSADLRLHIA